MQPRTGYGIHWRSLYVSCALALLTFLAFDLTQVDQAISNLFYEPATRSFMLEHDVLFERITHQWARGIPGLFSAAAICGLLLSFVWPLLNRPAGNRCLQAVHKTRLAKWLEFTCSHRRDFLFVIFAFALSETAIHYLKSHTGIYCPVETTLYGGQQLHIRWFESLSLFDKAGAGRCWPGGHASGGFGLVALYFVTRHRGWPHARKVLAFTLALGMVFGTTRVLQGWHYMSHTFWAGLVVWWCTWLMALAFYGLARPAAASTDSAPLSCPQTGQR